MATLDFSRSTRGFSMSDLSEVGFKAALATQPDLWRFTTPGGHALTLRGGGLTYDSTGRAKTGAVTSIGIDLGHDGAGPDITISGINAPAALLDNGPADFWRFLEGSDVIYGPLMSQGASAAGFTIFGDGLEARPGTLAGGSDVIHTGDGRVDAFGDVRDVGTQSAAAPTIAYRGGNDEILGLETAKGQTVSGDAANVYAGGKLTGGHDTIFIQSTNTSSVAGDALVVIGTGGTLAQVVGGNDAITGGPNSRVTLVGDVMHQYEHSLVRGGADTVQGGELAEYIVGDVFRMDGLGPTRLIGGDDTLSGNGGNDTIYGDVWFVNGLATIAGGNDVIRGGRGADKLYGDFNGGGAGSSGGDDQLYGGVGDDRLEGDFGIDVLNGDEGLDILVGDEGDDRLYGGSENDVLDGGQGDDQLDGGAGADDLRGGSGDDIYFVNDFGDKVTEGANAGADAVWSFLSYYVLGADVETLRFNGQGNFSGFGNGLGNTIQGGAESDYLAGKDGNDTLIGGAGADELLGGTGIDTASYASTTTGGVAAYLDVGGSGDAADDHLYDIENLAGSDFGDALYGNNGANTLWGGAGNDYLQGNGGDDTLVGGAGQDVLAGGLVGNDAFVFNARNDGRDAIRDFSAGAGNDDRLHFEGDAFGGLAAGALSAGRFVANASGLATTTNQRFVYETDTGVLRFDANGSASGGVTEVALLDGAPVLTTADFLIV